MTDNTIKNTVNNQQMVQPNITQNGNKPSIWNKGVNLVKKYGPASLPIAVDAGFSLANSTSPTQSGIYEPLWDQIKNTDDGYGYAANLADAVLSPTTSKLWDTGIEKAGDFAFNLANKVLSPISDTSNNTDNNSSVNNLVGAALGTNLKHNVANIAKNYVKDGLTGLRYGADYIPYFFPLTAIPKVTRDVTTTVLNNTWDYGRDLDSIKYYTYGDLGYNDFTKGDVWAVGRAGLAGLDNLFSNFGEDEDYYQRGRYSINEMVNSLEQDIQNRTDYDSDEYKQLSNKLTDFKNLAGYSDAYWQLQKDIENSNLSAEDYLATLDLTTDDLKAFEISAKRLHNLGANLAANEHRGIKRSSYQKRTTD